MTGAKKSAAQTLLAAAACAALAFPSAPARAADDYPTEVKADYIFACMAVHGQTRGALLQCSCSVDAVAEALPYSDYVAAETVMMLRQTLGGAERIAMFRGSPWAREMVAKLKRAQVEADFRCFGK